MCIITNALDTVGMHYGIGRHLYYLTPYQRMMAVKYDWISHAFAITATGLGKVAFALFLLRVIAANNKAQRWFLHGYNILLIAINIPLIIITYAQCSPTKALWDPSTVGAKCWDPKVQATYAVFQGCWFNPLSVFGHCVH